MVIVEYFLSTFQLVVDFQITNLFFDLMYLVLIKLIFLHPALLESIEFVFEASYFWKKTL